MSGCHNPETLELCKHLQPIKFGCNQCNDGYKKASPMVEQMQRLEERINFLEKENKMRKDAIGCVDSACSDSFGDIEINLINLKKTINENYSNCASRSSKSEDRIKELEDYIETGKLHNDWRHKIMGMEEKIKKLAEVIPRYDELHREWWNRIELLEKYTPLIDSLSKSRNDWVKPVNDLEKSVSDLVDKIAEMANFYYQEKKTPHKCPVCNGIGLQDISPSFTPPHTCCGCDGKGIVWG